VVETKTQEELDSWYDDEKGKAIERFQEALEKKQGMEASEKKYIAELNSIFEKYKKQTVELIAKNLEAAKIKAAAKASKGKNPIGNILSFINRRGKK
jgi:hypothetical protein